jgi:endonuclease G
MVNGLKRNKRIRPLYIVLLSLCFIVLFLDFSKIKQRTITLSQLEPKSKTALTRLNHKYYVVGYNEDNCEASYVCYLLTRNMVNNKRYSRGKLTFRKDYLLSYSYATNNDYKKSGYDKGHMCPADDMSWSSDAMAETFYLSNVCPQDPKLNRGKWKSLEEKVRSWADKNDSILVITGPIFTKNVGSIGKNKVKIPTKFYKIIIDISYPSYKAIAFVMDNSYQEKDISSYSTSIKQVETLTHLNFFPAFDKDELIQGLEKQNNISLWK